MRLHRLILTFVALRLFTISVHASTNSLLEPIGPTITSPSLKPLQTTQPKLYREHIYAGNQLVASVVYPDLQAANHGLPGLPSTTPETPIIVANIDPTTQRWLLMGHAGKDLILLLICQRPFGPCAEPPITAALRCWRRSSTGFVWAGQSAKCATGWAGSSGSRA